MPSITLSLTSDKYNDFFKPYILDLYPLPFTEDENGDKVYPYTENQWVVIAIKKILIEGELRYRRRKAIKLAQSTGVEDKDLLDVV